ncbi:SpoIID/LytB domain-containing protein [Halothece sp. PCC 7418]|uniref:SpoIID/LytB domain-containing protein n=1 Tax=Halothece sp. (strain PCC 7418) TaxID=65093 RepID=UPI0002DF1F10|nr:SpoIID/LytB domain-containing protein [Halothece sp. PCC 7418]
MTQKNYFGYKQRLSSCNRAMRRGVRVSLIALLGAFSLFTPTSVRSEPFPIEVGIVQRFGEELSDEMTLTSPNETPLTVTVKNDGTTETLKTDRVTLEIKAAPLAKPKVRERVILSDHATFESAETSAQIWAKRGIITEVTQPGRWQVWAKSEVYHSPLLRRFLLESLQREGYNRPYLETEVLEEVVEVSFLLDGKRYTPETLEIHHESEQLYVKASDVPRRLYPGHLHLQPNSYGNYTLVNIVPIESYLRGVVPHEIGPNAPLEAVKAQAIIARTYALRNLHRFQADDYEICANTHCQVYWGLSDTNARSDRAIQETSQQILSYQGNLVDALYSSTTGGVTAFFSDIWDGQQRPYLRSVVDSPQPVWDLDKRPLSEEENFRAFIKQQQGFNETGSRAFRWEKQSSIEQLTEDLQTYLERIKHPLAEKIDNIEEMTVTARSRSGRILQMDVQTDQGPIILKKTEVRSAFGPPRSTLFYVDPVRDDNGELEAYQFIGGGFGHGVGLSQIGAHHLAKQGWSAQDILYFYYPDTEILLLDEVSDSSHQ